MMLLMTTLTTPRKPWSFFLNFFWSKIWTVRTLSSVTLLQAVSSRRSKAAGVQVKALVPVGVQRLLYDGGGAGLLAVDGGHSKGVGEA
jgi:hypothetical protein